MRDFKDLKKFAESAGFTVTSTTGGSHNANSKHFLGLAIDVRTRGKSNEQIERFMRQCAALGVRVRDERKRPANQKIWSGAHLHLEITGETLETVRKFQKQNDLTPDGIVGKLTLKVINSIF